MIKVIRYRLREKFVAMLRARAVARDDVQRAALFELAMRSPEPIRAFFRTLLAPSPIDLPLDPGIAVACAPVPGVQ